MHETFRKRPQKSLEQSLFDVFSFLLGLTTPCRLEPGTAASSLLWTRIRAVGWSLLLRCRGVDILRKNKGLVGAFEKLNSFLQKEPLIFSFTSTTPYVFWLLRGFWPLIQHVYSVRRVDHTVFKPCPGAVPAQTDLFAKKEDCPGEEGSAGNMVDCKGPRWRYLKRWFVDSCTVRVVVLASSFIFL